MALLTVFALTFTILLFGIQSSFTKPHDDECNEIISNCSRCFDNICLTHGCIKSAAEVLDKIDFSVDPCDNFYRFACGGFINNSIIPEDHNEVQLFALVSDQLNEQLKKILKEEAREDELGVFKKVKMLYANCMDKDRIEEIGIAVVRDLLDELCGWPLLLDRDWNSDDFDWKNITYKFRELGFNPSYFFTIEVSVDVADNTKRIIYIETPSFGLSRDYLILGRDEKVVKAYYEYMINLAVYFGVDKKVAVRDIGDVLDFEIALANNTLSSQQRRNITMLYNKLKLKEVQAKYPTIPWVEYINILLKPFVTITAEEHVILIEPNYIKALESLLLHTPKKVVANYLMMTLIKASADLLSDEVRNIKLKFRRAVEGTKDLPPRWKKCVLDVKNALPNVVGALYIRKYFDQKSKSEIKLIMGYIREEFEKILKNNDWMDVRTKDMAIEKLRAVTEHIAYPDELLDDKVITEEYDKIVISPGDFYTSILNVNLYKTDFDYKRLREPVNKTEWISHGNTAVVNAFYHHVENSIIFPAGILQKHFFNVARPRYMNFGAFGSVVGHELTHGFDDIGRQFDKHGNLKEWWDPKTRNSFLQKAECIVEQYGNYTIGEVDMKINGRNTQGENIADNGGMSESYHAYQTWVKRNGPEPELPGLNLTSNQLYWVSVAQTWCSKITKQKLRSKVLIDTHSPDEFRIIGPFSNLEEFSADFGCPLGSNMNPAKKCKVW